MPISAGDQSLDPEGPEGEDDMASTFRFAVLSDLHIDREEDSSSWQMAKSAFRAAGRAKADHIVVVGDTFDCSTAMDRDQGKLRKFLAKEGLWDRDRLTIVVGNHDIFHTAHRGSRRHRATELAKATQADGQQMYDSICAWAGELVLAEDRCATGDLFPLSKDLGTARLTCLDTTESSTVESSNASRAKDELPPLPRVADGRRHVLAIHNAPVRARASVADSLQGYTGGFSKKHFRRLQRFADDARVDAIVCGHIHDNGDDGYAGQRDGGHPVHLMGRSGDLHGIPPVIGLLDVPATGKLRWSEVELWLLGCQPGRPDGLSSLNWR